MEREMITPADAAELMGCSAHNVRNQLASGNLPGVKVGGRWYVNREELLRTLGLSFYSGPVSVTEVMPARFEADAYTGLNKVADIESIELSKNTPVVEA